MDAVSDLREMLSQRGKILLVYECNKFKQCNTKLASGETKWRCIKDKCGSHIYTLGESNNRVITKINNIHCHPPEKENVLQRQILTSSIKRKATEDITEKPCKIIRKELTNSSTSSGCLTSYDLYRARKNMYNARRKVLPVLPKSILEVQEALKTLNPETNRQEKFLIVNDTSESLVIFSCKTNLKFLCDSACIYMDGTFDYCTKFFKQLFTIYGFLNGHYIPLVFGLLKDKNEITYELCLTKLKEYCIKLNMKFEPQEIVVDFELAIHNAVKSVWPNIKITGCRFHLTQAWYRQIQKLGLTTEYKERKSEVGIWLRYCFGLLFLKPEDVEDFNFFDLYELKPKDDRLEKFSDYLLDNYLTNSSLFPPNIWADASAAMNKTTNACESFHAHFNNSMYQTHPSLFIFVNMLISVQTETYIKCNSINTVRKFENIASKKRHDFLKNKIEEYCHKKISKLQYVKILSNYYS